jgi:hypothetical protein
MSLPYTDSVDLLTGDSPADSAGVKANTIGGAYDISKRQLITIQFVCTAYTSGDAMFTIDVSNDGTNWITGMGFLDPTTTTPTTWVVSKAITSKTSSGVVVQPGWKYIRVNVSVAGTGTYSAFMHAAG